jgi:hypothetical protein
MNEKNLQIIGFIVMFFLLSDVRTCQVNEGLLTHTSCIFTLWHLWRNKEQERIVAERNQIFSLIGLDFSLMMDEQMSGFVEPCLYFSAMN